MRIVWVWFTFIVSTFIFTLAWFTLSPVFNSLMSVLDNWVSGVSLPSAASNSYTTVKAILEYLWIWVILIIIFGLLLWAYLSSQQREWESWRE